jgi:hypothetical protein
MAQTWADPNLNDFYKRVARIEYTHARGHGFIADGALGRADFLPHKTRRSPVVGPVILILAFGFMLKGTLHQQLGADVFNERVVTLKEGVGVDRLGGYLMQADPITLTISREIDKALQPGGLLDFDV